MNVNADSYEKVIAEMRTYPAPYNASGTMVQLWADRLQSLQDGAWLPIEQYHEDMGPVTWWAFPICEPAWIGTPNDSDWPNYHTHFTPHPSPPPPPNPESSNGKD